MKISELRKYLEYYKSREPCGIVIKIGGDVIDNPDSLRSLACEEAYLYDNGLFPVNVHGGGKPLDRELERRGIKTRKVGGIRITDKETLDAAVKVFGDLNKLIVDNINYACGRGLTAAYGITKEPVFIVEKIPYLKENGIEVDPGYVGNIVSINEKPIIDCITERMIPVIWCLGYDKDGQIHNINADNVAAQTYLKLNSKKFIMTMGIGGIYNNGGELVSRTNLAGIKQMIKDGTLKDGAGYKGSEIIYVLENRGDAVIQITGPGNIRKELFTEKGAGTYITRY